MYVAVKGGEKAVENSHNLLACDRRGNPGVPELAVKQISEQLSLAVARVMTEGSLYDTELAALAIKQARGDLIEAIYLLRAFRTTLPRLLYSEPIKTEHASVDRRISATFKDLPGGQILGPTFDYSHRMLDFDLLSEGPRSVHKTESDASLNEAHPRVVENLLERDGLIEAESETPYSTERPVGDITREPLAFPPDRDVRLQCLVRGDEGFILSLGYSTMRGFGDNHGFVGELRYGSVALEVTPPELGLPIKIGEVLFTECETINQHRAMEGTPAQFTRGYGIALGQCERKVIAMALVDRALRSRELGEDIVSPAQDEEFVLSHCDATQAAGFVEHIKLPHYGGFQSELDMVRRIRADAPERRPINADAAE